MKETSTHDKLLNRIKELEDQVAEYRGRLDSLSGEAENYRLLVEHVPDMIWILSTEKFKLSYLSPSVEKMLGYTVEEALALPFEEMVTPDSLERVRRYYEEIRRNARENPDALEKSYQLEVQNYRKDKTPIWVEVIAQPAADENGNITRLIGVSRDISGRVRTQEALEKSEARYRNLFEDSRDVIYITARTGEFIDINPAGEALFGYSRDQIIGSNVLDLYESPRDRERFTRQIEAQGEVRDYEIRFRKKDGKAIDCLVTASLWKGDDDTIYGYHGIIRDITLKKHFEKNLQHVQKMEAIGTLAGGIAHNFNNLLMAIQGNASLLLLKTPPGDPGREKLKTIERHVQYGSELSNQLLGFARGGAYHRTTLDVNPLIKMSSKLFSATRREVTCYTRLEGGLWPIDADPGQIEQILINLLVNAWQAMTGNGEINIQTENVTLGKFQIAPFQGKPGRYIKISVTDNGCGMDAATQQKIFEPFFTTKQQGEGTGLGLSSAYGIVKHHGGYITVYSEQEKGSTFNVYLPAAQKEPAPEKSAPESLLRGNETVLVIDDEQEVAETARVMLKELGYTVFTAESGKAGAELYASHHATIDLVVLDMVMPNMGSQDTFDELCAIEPRIRVLLSSGYNINSQATELLNQGCRGFIQKPFNLIDLSRKIREVIDGK